MEYKKNFSDSLSLTPSSLGSSTLSSTTSAASSATSSATTSTSTTSTFSEIQKKATNFFNNKYLRAVLYIILILYASLIAPKLPDWIIPYLEYPIVKIFIIANPLSRINANKTFLSIYQFTNKYHIITIHK